jgi:hypothetical protein
MKQKSGVKVLSPATNPELLARNPKWRGEVIELDFLHKAASMGFTVTKTLRGEPVLRLHRGFGHSPFGGYR